MDAIRYLKEKARMTERCAISCLGCLLSTSNNKKGRHCKHFELNYPEEAVAIIEKWAAEHPVKTRQDEFLKMFPNAEMEGGVVKIDPCTIDRDNALYGDTVCNKYDVCNECRRDYWLAEVD